MKYTRFFLPKYELNLTISFKVSKHLNYFLSQTVVFEKKVLRRQN